jgi:predicted MFS family arabinose efflux permease
VNINAERLDNSAGATVAGTAPEARTPTYSWYVVGLMTLAFLLASMDRSLISVVVEPVRQEFKLTDAQVGFLAGLAFGIPFALASLPMGMLIDRYNRRNLLALAITVWSTLTAACGFAQNFLQMAVARMMVGAAESAFPAAQSIITDYFPARKRPMALGIYFSGGSIAFFLTFAVGGLIVEEWGWRAVFWLAGPPGILLSLLLMLTLREPPRGGSSQVENLTPEPALPLVPTLRYLFAQRTFLHMFIAYALIAATNASFWTWIGSLLIRVHGLPIGQAGILIAVGAGVCGSLGAFGGAAISARLGRRGMKDVLSFIAIAAVIVTPLGIAMAMAPSVELALAAMVLVSIAKSTYVGPAQGIIFSVARARMRGVAGSLLNIAGTLLGFGLGPLIAGTISQVLGGGVAIRYGLAALFLCNLWAALHFWLARRTVEEDVAKSEVRLA